MKERKFCTNLEIHVGPTFLCSNFTTTPPTFFIFFPDFGTAVLAELSPFLFITLAPFFPLSGWSHMETRGEFAIAFVVLLLSSSSDDTFKLA